MHKLTKRGVLGFVGLSWVGLLPLAFSPLFCVPAAAQSQGQMAQTPQAESPPIYFRTKSYRVRLAWRRGYPYLSVGNNGWDVMADVPAIALKPRGDNDPWTSYRAKSGDYTATVRLGPGGAAAIAISLAGKRIVQEAATFSTATPKPAVQLKPSVTQQEVYVFGLQTPEYAVRVYRQQGDLWLNLYDKQAQKTLLRRVPATERRTTDSTIYQYDGETSVQARENIKGERSLLLIRDNAIQYRGEGF